MNTKQFVAVSVCLVVVLLSSMCPAVDITAVAIGNWSDTNTWSTQTIPGINDDIDVPSGITVTVDTNVMIQFIYDSGSVTMGPNSSLNVFNDSSIATSIALDTSAPGNTIIYSCNPFFALERDYYNLVLANTNWAPMFPQYYPWPWQNFNNFSQYGPTPMHIAGNWTLLGAVTVQQGSGGAPITIDGNLTIGPDCVWDCSGDNLTVGGNAYIYGVLEDLNSALGSNYIGGSVTVSGPSKLGAIFGEYTNGWDLGDVTTWGVGGGLTNNGAIAGVGYGRIIFNGAGSIAGSNILTVPTIRIDGTYAIDDTIILTTNNADFNGTLVFDLLNTNQIVLQSSPAGPNNQTNYYSGNLVVVNTGAAPGSGKSYKFFNAANYAGGFASENLPSLSPGLSWVDNLAISGSIAITGSGGSPLIILTRTGNLLTLSWDSTNYPGYSIQAETNVYGLGQGTQWAPAGGTTTSPFYATANPTNPPVFFRLTHP
jgi:hypothetical protein